MCLTSLFPVSCCRRNTKHAGYYEIYSHVCPVAMVITQTFLYCGTFADTTQILITKLLYIMRVNISILIECYFSFS